MKKLIIILCLLPALSCAGTSKHDFHYYKQKTIELLPILGINKVDINFQATHKTPSFEQRIKSQNTIFINLETLNKLPDNVALFECALQSKMATINLSEIIESAGPTNTFKKTVLEIVVVTFTILWPGVFAFRALYSQKDSTRTLIHVFLLAGGIWFWYMNRDIDSIMRTINAQIIFIKRIQKAIIDCIYDLLKNEATCALAFTGFENYVRLIPSQPLSSDLPEGQSHTLNGVCTALTTWSTQHPDQWQEIKKALKPETTALIESKPLEDKNQGKS